MVQLDLKEVQEVVDKISQHCLDLLKDFFENGREELRNLGIGADYQVQVNEIVDKITETGKDIAKQEMTLVQDFLVVLEEEKYTFNSDVFQKVRDFVKNNEDKAAGGDGSNGGGILSASRTPILE